MGRGFGPFFIMKEVIYEPHPVSPERKAELIKSGYKILDARFAPVEEQKTKVKRRGSSKKDT